MINLTVSAPALQDGHTHSNNSSAIAGEFFECVWPFYGVSAERVKCVYFFSWSFCLNLSFYIHYDFY